MANTSKTARPPTLTETSNFKNSIIGGIPISENHIRNTRYIEITEIPLLGTDAANKDYVDNNILPGGVDTQIQFNDGGSFGGISSWTTNGTTEINTSNNGVMSFGTGKDLKISHDGNDSTIISSVGDLIFRNEGNSDSIVNRIGTDSSATSFQIRNLSDISLFKVDGIGLITVNGKIGGVSTPTLGSDAANKDYVDNNILPGGVDTQIQFNDGGSFGGISSWTTNGTTEINTSDNGVMSFGTGKDLKISHDGNDSTIISSVGDLIFRNEGNSDSIVNRIGTDSSATSFQIRNLSDISLFKVDGTGLITVNGKIGGVSTPTLGSDAANKDYVDNNILPGGVDTQIQFNDGGSFGGISSWTTNGTTEINTLNNGVMSFGTGKDLKISHDGNDSTIISSVGDLIFRNEGNSDSIVNRIGTDSSATSFQIRNLSDISLFKVDGTGLITVNGKIGGVSIPTLGTDAANKDYIDNNILPGGVDTQIQFNDGGSFGGISSWTTNGTTEINTSDNGVMSFGTGKDLKISHDGNDSTIISSVGDLIFRNEGNSDSIVNRIGTDSSATSFQIRNLSDISLFKVDGTGLITVNGKIGGVSTPTLGTDAANKDYIDNNILPGGVDTQIQFNDGSSFGGISSWTTNGTTEINTSDNGVMSFGTGKDLKISHDGNDSTIISSVGDLIFRNEGNSDSIVNRIGTDSSATSFQIRNLSDISLFKVDGTGLITVNGKIGGVSTPTLGTDAANKDYIDNNILPGGVDTQIQFNDGSSFGGISSWTTNGTTEINTSDNGVMSFGTGKDLKISHDGNDSTIISSVGDLIFRNEGNSDSIVNRIGTDSSATSFQIRNLSDISLFKVDGTGLITVNGKIEGVSTPTLGTDAANKDYIDNNILPGGVDTQIQFNDGGSFGGISSWTTNGTTEINTSDNGVMSFGTGKDLKISHDGNDSTITNDVGSFTITNGDTENFNLATTTTTGELNIGTSQTLGGNINLGSSDSVINIENSSLNVSNYETADESVSTWTMQTSATPDGWRSITWSPELSLFCAISSSGSNRVMTSPDGINWTSRTSSSNNDWYDITWSPELGLFCAVSTTGTGDRVMTSPDGITWTSQTSAADNEWFGITWSPELSLFCAVSIDGSKRVMTSPSGINWTSHTSAVNNRWRSVIWSPELGLFCAVSDSGSTYRVMTSPDGITWTSQTSAADNQWFGITWSPELGLFCAVSRSGTDRVMTSPDGINWTTYNAAVESQWSDITWSPELGLFCAVSVSIGHIMTSSDGITWTERTNPTSTQFYGITWSPELSLFCAVSITNDVSNNVSTSSTVTNTSVNIGAQNATDVSIRGKVLDIGKSSYQTNIGKYGSEINIGSIGSNVKINGYPYIGCGISLVNTTEQVIVNDGFVNFDQGINKSCIYGKDPPSIHNGVITINRGGIYTFNVQSEGRALALVDSTVTDIFHIVDNVTLGSSVVFSSTIRVEVGEQFRIFITFALATETINTGDSMSTISILLKSD